MEKIEIVRFSNLLPKSKWFDSPEWRLIVGGDIQYDGRDGDCDTERLEKYVKFARENDFEVLLLGDCLNLGNSRERRSMLLPRLETPKSEILYAINRYAEERLDELLDILSPLRGRVPVVIRGHHYFVFENGEESDYIIAKELGAKFAGDSADVRLVFRDRKRKKSLVTRMILHHGHGYGESVWAPITKLMKIVPHFPGTRVFAVGHHSKQIVTQIPGISWEADEKIWLVACGSMMRGYKYGRRGLFGLPEGTYIEKRMMPPAALGWPAVYFTLLFDEGRIDIRAEET